MKPEIKKAFNEESVFLEKLIVANAFSQSHRFITVYIRTCGPGSVVGITTGYGLERSGDRIPVAARFSAPVQNGPGAHPASCTMGTACFPGVKSGRGLTLTPHPLLVPWSWNSRAIPLLPVWTVPPVHSLTACTRVHFTFTLHKANTKNWRRISHTLDGVRSSFLRKKRFVITDVVTLLQRT
jgi:hypothetical protein